MIARTRSSCEEVGRDRLEAVDFQHGPLRSRLPSWLPAVWRVDRLSPREAEVFWQLGQGLSNQGIGARLSVTQRTVKAHITQILIKLGLESRLQAGLASFAYHELDLIPPVGAGDRP